MPTLTRFLKTTPGKLTAAGGGLLGLCALCLACSVFGTLLPERDDAAPAATQPEPAAPAATIQAVEPAQLADLPTQAAPTASPLPPPTHTPLPPTPTASPTDPPAPPPATEAPAPEPAEGLPDLPLQEAQVVNIVDGDTIDVLIEGGEYRIRYILMDTPETHGGTEPFGPEASAANAALVAGQTVWLEKDVSETDRYGRLLRYVYLADGRMVNEELLRQGLATVATFPPDVKYVERFLAVQAEARAGGVGLWAEPGLAESEPAPTAAPAAPEPAPTVAPPPGPVSGGPLVIVALNKRDEFADLQNVSDAAVDLTGWRLLSEKGNQDCPLGGVIEPGQTLRVWALADDADQGGFSCGYGSNIWNNSERDAAVLFDPSGAEISRME